MFGWYLIHLIITYHTLLFHQCILSLCRIYIHLYSLARPFFHVHSWFYLHLHSSCLKDTWQHFHNMLYSIDDELFHMLYITAGVRLQLCLYAYDFVMSGCLCIHSLHENCYCVPRHCLQLLQNNTNKMLRAPPPTPSRLPPCLPFQTQTSVPSGQ